MSSFRFPSPDGTTSPTAFFICILPVFIECRNDLRYKKSARVSPDGTSFSLTVGADDLIFDDCPVRMITSEVSLNTE